MVRKTSIDTYNDIKKNGMLSDKRFKVYSIIYNHGPLTGGEVAQIYRREIGDESRYSESIRNRITELNEAGVIGSDVTKICSVSRRKSMLWDVTGNLPEKINKKLKLQKEILKTKEKLDKLVKKYNETYKK